MTSSSIKTAARLYRIPALLNALLHAFSNVLFVIVLQSAASWKLLSSVIAMKIPTTMMAMLIMELKSTKLCSIPSTYLMTNIEKKLDNLYL